MLQNISRRTLLVLKKCKILSLLKLQTLNRSASPAFSGSLLSFNQDHETSVGNFGHLFRYYFMPKCILAIRMVFDFARYLECFTFYVSFKMKPHLMRHRKQRSLV